MSALEKVVRTIFLPDSCKLFLTVVFEVNSISFFGTDKWATTKKATSVIT